MFRNIYISLFILTNLYLLSSCVVSDLLVKNASYSTSNTSQTLHSKAHASIPRVIHFNNIGDSISEDSTQTGFTSWCCEDYIHGRKVLVELGYFKLTSDILYGFILYDGTNTGDLVSYERRGLNHEWFWGNEEHPYVFVIDPNGTGLYYDLTGVVDGESTKPTGIYKAYKRK